ncbi:alkaline phosphatase family protein [Brevibacillus centrosporus]|uniref:alkaline phosphatase family protein n=2 Tax=Brevibacillus centrosporus TaxID=54910 RepID=UPI00116AF112|nr:alkaline phosphatase family protein [Brevibacillus centrosporus]MEC2132892.1 alkaline phosphatase family protein [Brevibacillus centrosporus]GED32286.1 hypothetical protein BCE02nite_34270 [Brevibacillus centrosporus]
MMSDKLAPYQDEFLYKRVVVIGIDGAGDAVKNPEANAANILKLMEEGAGTFEAKAMLPTISAQNWGAILHGVTPEKHGLTNDIVAATPYPEKNAYPSYMKLLKQERPKLAQASSATWGSINIGIIEDSAGAGHTHGYFTPEFYDQLQKEDENVGAILEALEENLDGGYFGHRHHGSWRKRNRAWWIFRGRTDHFLGSQRCLHQTGDRAVSGKEYGYGCGSSTRSTTRYPEKLGCPNSKRAI